MGERRESLPAYFRRLLLHRLTTLLLGVPLAWLGAAIGWWLSGHDSSAALICGGFAAGAWAAHRIHGEPSRASHPNPAAQR